ncbi:O-antigen polymerase [Sporolactobacillus nakayamae]|uniref:Oligosaccharide repeat unit polymerase n=1 Tax=Sporolactobacillus nakayamae TaxID=269670 RepID=A0A1I2VZ66_9BACL|nr:O-antigen polymerase [Sporolactobacillus nakayamae]SFG94505.1 hypothetical protein SAMN02982927_03325 [Sporolactobacillus nakayamae]
MIDVNRIINFILKPNGIVLLTSIASLLVWSYPDIGLRRGFIQKENFNSFSLLLIGSWYLSIYIFSNFGFNVGLRIKRINALDSVNLNKFYTLISMLAHIGVLYSYANVLRQDPAIFNSVIQGQANQLKNILYEDYSVGINTLRYLSILSGSISIFNIIHFKKAKFINISNIIMLLLTSLMSSRLAIVLTIILVIYLLFKNKYHFSLKKVIVICMIAFIVLTILNNSRNKQFYMQNYNINNPIISNLSEINTYIGSPFQGSVGVANNIETILPYVDYSTFFNYLTPTFIPIHRESSFYNINYRQLFDLDSSLTTNSTFLDIFTNLGWLGYILISIVSFLFSLIAGHFYRYSSIVSIIAPIITYCFAEIWRTYMFNVGIIWTLIIFTILCAIMSNKKTIHTNRQ